MRAPPGYSIEEKFVYHGSTVLPTGCWSWGGGSHDRDGYGVFKHKGKMWKAHRVSYEIWVGPIPDHHVVRHRCDNPPCVNPSHLETGTPADNMRDRDARGRGTRGEGQHMSKLTEDTVRQVRRRHGPGVTYQSLADEYGVSDVAIRLAILGKTWKHVE